MAVASGAHPAPRSASKYPHELSGGMRNGDDRRRHGRLKLLIADEPTTALDITDQGQILDLMAELKQQTGAAMALITHPRHGRDRLADGCA